MTSNLNHKKHAELKRTVMGSFGRNEIAIYGTECSKIKLFADQLRQQLSPFDIAYVDEDHAEEQVSNSFVGTLLQQKRTSTELHLKNFKNVFQNRLLLSQADLIVVNGNHFAAQNQLVFCNEKKEQSLRKRKDQLTHVIAILLEEGLTTIPEYVKEVVENHVDIPTLSVSDEVALAFFFQTTFLKPPPLKALIMAGGRSTRMGADKAIMQHHGMAQFAFLKQMMNDMKIESFVSCRAEQREYFENENCQVISDRIIDCGPLGGIASAFMHSPDSAWLVLACDVPLLDQPVLEELLCKRSQTHIATSYISPFDGMPEPLIAVWEPKAYSQIMQFLVQGYSCPRKVLMNNNTYLIAASEPEKLINMNTPEDLQKLKAYMSK